MLATTTSTPPYAACMVLVGTDDPDLRVDVDEFVMSMAAALDIRGDQPWVEVANGKNFTRAVVNAFSDRMDSIRLAHASMTATTAERAHRALYGESLMQIAKQLGMVAADGDEPMGYEVRFQPVMTLQGRALVGYEALVRGQTPQGTIDADELIRRAEAKNSLRELDQLSRSLSMRGVGPWLGEGLLFLNVAAPNGAFDLDAIFATIDQAEAGGLAPDQLVFEAVERNRYNDLDEAAEQVQAIRARGARIAMDDTGDGYASLRVMAAFSPDIVRSAGSSFVTFALLRLRLSSERLWIWPIRRAHTSWVRASRTTTNFDCSAGWEWTGDRATSWAHPQPRSVVLNGNEKGDYSAFACVIRNTVLLRPYSPNVQCFSGALLLQTH